VGKSGRLVLAAALAAAAILLLAAPRTVLTVDVSLFKAINGHPASALDAVFWIVSAAGSGIVLIPLFAVFLIFRSPRKQRLAAVLIAAVAFSLNAAATAVFKQAVGRNRPVLYFASSGAPAPAANTPAFAVHVVGVRLRDHAFPSGHTNTAFGAATLLVLFFGRKYRPAYLFAAAIAYSRVYLGAHFPLDTLAGAGLGSAVAWAAWRGSALLRPISPSSSSSSSPNA